MPKKDKLIPVYKSSATPFPLGVVASGHTSPMLKSVGVKDHYKIFYAVFTNKNGEWYFYKDEIKRIGEKVLKALVKNPRLISKCEQNYKKYISRALKQLDKKKLEKNLPKMSNKKIAGLLANTLKQYYLASTFPEQPGFSLELEGQNIIKKNLTRFFRNNNIKIPSSKIENFLGTASNFTQLSFTQIAEIELLKICLLAKEKKNKAITNYGNRYYWLFYDYYGPILNESEIKKELKAYEGLKKKNILERIKKIQSQSKKNKIEQEKLLEKYKLTKDLRTSFKVLREMGYLYTDTKKKFTSRVNVGLGQILGEISKRTGVGEHALHFTSPEELNSLLTKNLQIKAELNPRLKNSILVCASQVPYYKFAKKEQITKIKKLLNAGQKHSVSEFKGIPACSGRYTGTIKVIKNASQVPKLKKGEILVTTMTTVNFVPAMKKSGAIITDIGGITSHAAIISRELGIPCVIGTKIATRVLKDGDKVEVNANHGWIRKIK